MSGMSTMNFRLPNELYTAFSDKALSENRTASDVLRSLMREWLEKDSAKPASLTAIERRRRMKAVEFARASVELEGYSLPDSELARFQQFCDGPLSLEQLVTPDE